MTVTGSPRTDAINNALEALSNRDPRVRAAAIDSIASFCQEPRVRRALLAAFRDKAWIVRMQAAEAATQFGTRGRTFRLALRRLLDDRNELVRIEALSSLGFLKDRGARRAIHVRLADRSPLVRSYAAAAIGQVGSGKDLSRLHERLREERVDAAKVGYYDAVITLGDVSAIGALVELLDSADFEVRCATASTMVHCVAHRRNAAQFALALRRRLRHEPSPNVRACLRDNLRALYHRFPKSQNS